MSLYTRVLVTIAVVAVVGTVGPWALIHFGSHSTGVPHSHRVSRTR